MWRVQKLTAMVAILAAAGTSAGQSVMIQTVRIGNPGNAGDTRYPAPPKSSFGAVAYAFEMGVFEVTAGQYRDFLNAVDPAGSNPYGLYTPQMDSNPYGCQITWNSASSVYDFSGRPSGTEAEWTDRPVNWVSWGDAARFCNWLHNGQPTGQLTGDPSHDSGLTEDGSYHLNGATSDAALQYVVRDPDATWVIPTEDEWYKAAYHNNDGVMGNYYDYPTSSDTVPGYVTDSGTLSGTGAPFIEGGTDPGNYATLDGDSYVRWGIGAPYYRTEAGEWENSASPYGTFDQAGNVWEWNADIVCAHAFGMRGTFFGDNVNAHASRRSCDPASYEFYNVGFRVARVSLDAVPAVAEWGLAVLALLIATGGAILLTGRTGI